MTRSYCLLAVVITCGCSILYRPSAEVRRARAAYYKTSRTVVLAAIDAELAARYPGVRVTQMPFRDADYFISDWWWVDGKRMLGPEQIFCSNPPIGHFIRLHFALNKSGPIAVNVYAEVDRYKEGWVTTATYDRGSSIPEMRHRPPWIQDRIDDMDVAIDRRLRSCALDPRRRVVVDDRWF